MAAVGVSVAEAIELDESTDEEAAARSLISGVVAGNENVSATSIAPPVKKQRVEVVAATVATPIDVSDSMWGTERRSRRSLAESLSFSELQAQQRALEMLHARVHKKTQRASHKASAKPKPIVSAIKHPVSAAKSVVSAVKPVVPTTKPDAPTAAAAASSGKPKPIVPAPKATSLDWSTPSLVWRIPPPQPAQVVATAAAAAVVAVATATATATATVTATAAATAVASASRSAPHVAATKPPSRPHDSDSDFETTMPPAQPRIGGRFAAAATSKLHAPALVPLDSKRHERAARARTTVREAIRILDSDDSDEDYALLLDTYSSDDDDSDSDAAAPARKHKRKRKRAARGSKKSEQRKHRGQYSTAAAAAAKPTEPVEIVSDILRTRRDMSNTVIHNTSWRQCYFDAAPLNLLPGEARPCLLSTVDPPLTAFDATGELESKCAFVSLNERDASESVDADTSDDAQEAMDARVQALEDQELPKLSACYRVKTHAILSDMRAQVRNLLRDHAVHRARPLDLSNAMHKLDVSPVERSLIRQMAVPAVLSECEHAALRYSIGTSDDGGKSSEPTRPSLAVRVCKFHMQSRSTTYVAIERSVRVEDDLILRYVPYFGDNESGKEIDVKQYERIRHQEACDRSCLDDEVSEHLLRLVVRACGRSSQVFRALQRVCGFPRASAEYDELTRDYDSKRRAAQRIDDARALLLVQQQPDKSVSALPDATFAQVVTLFRDAAILDAPAAAAAKPLAERLAPPPTFFESNFARRDAEPRTRRLGLRSANAYAALSEHYRDLYCRMCYTYDCQMHGIEHPQPRVRADPINPPLRLSPVALAARRDAVEVPVAPEDVKPSLPLPPSAPEDDVKSSLSPPSAETSDTPVAASPSNSGEPGDNDDEGSNSAGGNESTNSAQSQLQLEKRRSARPLTRVSSLATAFGDSFPAVERSRGHRAPRPPPPSVPRGADESEFLDDSHCAMVEAKVSAFEATSASACSATCWKVRRTSERKNDARGLFAVASDAVAAVAIDAINVVLHKLEDGCANDDNDDAATRFHESLSATERVLLQKARDAVGDSACAIATIVPTLACCDVHLFLERERRNALQKALAATLPVDAPAPAACPPPKRGRGRPPKNPDAAVAKRNRTQRQKERGSKHEFEPCNHDGPCRPDGGCSCITRDHMCEKACSCSRDCPNRFEGCRCSLGNCRTNACPCFVAMRECNPDVCLTCGASEVPVLAYDAALQHQSAIALGICCNVNLQRGQHKTLGVSFSTTHGWGAFAREPIKRGEFIYEYKGAIISQEEAERRGSIYDKNAISFLFDANEDAVVDAIRKGNKSKFANHASANPKCMPKVFRVGGEHRIAFWATQDIRRGEEIFFDYGYSGESAPDWSQLRLANSKRR